MDHRDHPPRFLLLQQCTSSQGRPLEAANFARAAGLAPAQLAAFDTLAAPAALSLLDGIAGIFIGGSAWSVFEDVPNLSATRALLAAAREQGIPLMGVCFGSQLIAQMFGGSVERDNANEEFGTIDILATGEAAAHPWFGRLPQRFAAQSSHQDRIVRLPEGAHVLASSSRCPVQAYAFADEAVFGVQFHPERRKEDAEALFGLPGYEGALEKIASGPFPLAESPESAAVLASFVRCAEQEQALREDALSGITVPGTGVTAVAAGTQQ